MLLKEKAKQKPRLHQNIAEGFREMDQNSPTYCKRVPYHRKSRVLSSTVRICLSPIYRFIGLGLRSAVQEKGKKKGGGDERYAIRGPTPAASYSGPQG